MQHTPKATELDSRLSLLVLPSWLSGMAESTISIVFCFGTILFTRYQASNLRLDFLDYQASQLSSTYQKLSEKLAANSLIGNLPLFILWGLVGLVVYMFAVNLFAALHSGAELKSELQYVNTDRHNLLRRAFQRLGIRLVVSLAWAGYLLFFFHRVVPYIIALSITGSGQLNILENAGFILLATIILAVALHIHTVLLRLLLLRPRAFSKAFY